MNVERHKLLLALVAPVVVTFMGLFLGSDEMVIGGCIFASLIFSAAIFRRITRVQNA